MNQIRKIFQGLSIRQRVSLILVAVLAIVALYAFTQWSHERDFKPLYSNLSSERSLTTTRRERSARASSPNLPASRT